MLDLQATSCLAHARLQLSDPDAALKLATSHPRRQLDNAFGDRLGIVAAIARIQNGDIETGIAEIAAIHQRADEVPWATQPEDLAIAVAYIAHLLGHSDLTRQIIDTGVIGFGPWIGYLVPKICRDLDIPLTRSVSNADPASLPDIDHLATVSARALSDLRDRLDS